MKNFLSIGRHSGAQKKEQRQVSKTPKKKDRIPSAIHIVYCKRGNYHFQTGSSSPFQVVSGNEARAEGHEIGI